MRNSTQHPEWSVKKIAKVSEVSQKTVFNVLKRFRESLCVLRKPGSGRKAGPVNKRLAKLVKLSLRSNPGLSLRERANHYNVSTFYIRKLRNTMKMKSFRMIKAPNRSDKQESTARKRARKLYDTWMTKKKGCCIMDDETYVKADFRQLAGRNFYVSTIRGNVPKKFKYIFCDKFAKKFLVWQAICTCGMRSDVFITSLNLNQDIYMKECLEKRVLPMIRKHGGRAWFWPDLASCHYSKKVMDWYEQHRVDIVPKKLNPPNCPELRPIERYWAIMKRWLKRTKGCIQTTNQLRLKWRLQEKNVPKEVVRNLMSGLNGKVRKFLRIDKL